MENDETIAFHGTSEQNFKAICEQGFRFAEVLQSLSFAKDSSGALGYACQKRSEASPNGCIIAVQFDDLSKPGIKIEHSIIHVYRLDSAPRVIGYCIIPEYYRHI